MENRHLLLIAAAFLSVAPLIMSLVARDSIKRSRRRHIKSLEDFFEFANASNEIKRRREDEKTENNVTQNQNEEEESKKSERENFIKSLEFLKFKYGMKYDKNPKERIQSNERPEIEPDAWLLSAILLASTLFGLLLIATIAANGLLCEKTIPQATCIEVYLQKHHSVGLVLLASIGGAYTYMLRAFYQAVQNFDLFPSSFFGAANNLIFGVVVTQIAIFYLARAAANTPTAIGVLMITAFIGAYMPDDILRYFLSLSSIKQLKEERSDFGREIQSISVEVLDGIDSKVRYRLADFHIESIQNLASANPLMLFVETPYGFYQTLDWVGQAQLCASAGPDATFKLWKLGIRTIFDLERATLTKGFVNDELLQMISRILLPDLVTPTPWSPDPIIANVKVRVDGSDTRRLRQIVNCVNEQLREEAATLT